MSTKIVFEIFFVMLGFCGVGLLLLAWVGSRTEEPIGRNGKMRAILDKDLEGE